MYPQFKSMTKAEVGVGPMRSWYLISEEERVEFSDRINVLLLKTFHERGLDVAWRNIDFCTENNEELPGLFDLERLSTDVESEDWALRLFLVCLAMCIGFIHL